LDPLLPGLRKKAAYAGLAARFASMNRTDHTVLVGIDGPGGAGKSTFAGRLAHALAGVFDPLTVIHVDDFFLPSARRLAAAEAPKSPGDEYDLARLSRQVLAPLRHNIAARYQRYDWQSDTLAEWHTIPPGGAVLVEGVYCLRPDIEGTYDFSIWVECPASIRLERGLTRDGDQARDRWTREWMPMEEEYV
jgi:uridine kinase